MSIDVNIRTALPAYKEIMLSALRANSTCGCLHATRLTSDLLNQATEALHTSVATATDKPAAANKTKSGAAAAASGVAAGASKDPMYCWLYPILYKPDQGWLYQMVPASADEKAAAAKVRTTTRYLIYESLPATPSCI